MENNYLPVPTEKDYEIAAANGISKKHVFRRVKYSDWSIERSITEPVKKYKEDKHESMIIIAERNGISRPTYLKRVKEEGMPPYEAATKPVGYSIYLKLAAETGIKEITFYKRVERGMDPYKAATKQPRIYKKKQIS
ncbi:hypothetical protein [Bacillus cereus]|uniref:hypothetical protein n=1 Tax=Bacillus cereus TaxID=1396 RepID=UPI0039B6EEF6